MEGDVIKSFLVGLGFGVDDASLAKFNKAIATAAVRVTALFTTIQAAATGIFYGISKISEGFEQMGYDLRLIAPMINKTLVLRQELLKAYAMAGVNLQKVVVQSVKFNMSLAKTQYALKALYTSVGARFFPLLTRNMDVFRKKIYEAMPTIQASLEKFVNFVFKAFDATVILGTRVWSILQRVYDFFVSLDKATDGWSTIILGAVAAWKLLNLSFLATPLGMILTGLTAILALYDDFKVWQEGGKSFFNWGPVVPYINMVEDALNGVLELYKELFELFRDSYMMKFWDLFAHGAQNVLDILKNLWGVVDHLAMALKALWDGDAIEFIHQLFEAAGSGVDVFKGMIDNLRTMYDILKNIASFGGAVWEKLFGEAPVVPTGFKGAGGAAPAPLGVQSIANSSSTNQNVNQQTTINVNGSSDAQSVGKTVASEQTRVNFDMARNFKAAVQ